MSATGDADAGGRKSIKAGKSTDTKLGADVGPVALGIGGPLLAGLAVAALGVNATLIIASLLFALGTMATGVLVSTYTQLWNDCPESKVTSRRSYALLVKSPITGLRAYLAIPSERAMAAICFVINFALLAFFLLFVPTIVHDKNLSPSAIGMLDGAFAVGTLFGSIFVVRRSVDRMGRTATMASGMLMCGFSIVVTALCPHGYATAALFLGGMGLIMLNINIMTVRALATPKTHIGSFCASAAPIFIRNGNSSQPPIPQAMPKLRLNSVGRVSSPP